MKNLALARNRATAALKMLYVADSLAMPVHWYYNPMDIYRQFRGGIAHFEDAPDFHPSSIMSLHSTSKGGRGARGSRGSNGSKVWAGAAVSNKQIVGDVILIGKRKFWNQPNQHYHHGMRAGENTLNAHCARAVTRMLVDSGGKYDEAAFLDAYIELLTADPPMHPDTYAESYHRGFFANLEAGKPRHKCGAVTHDTPSIGGLVCIAPIVFSERLRGTSLDVVQEICQGHLKLTHPDQYLAKVCRDYVGLLDDLLFLDESESAQQLISAWSKRSISLQLSELMGKIYSDNDVVGKLFSSACYITDSWPSVLYLAYKYCDSPEAGLISNTNLGGDNVHRGAVLATLLGLASGETLADHFAQLVDRVAIDLEITQLVEATCSEK